MTPGLRAAGLQGPVQRRRSGSVPTVPGAGAGLAQPATQRLAARAGWRGVVIAAPAENPPGRGILAPAGCRWWGRGQAARNPQIDATYLSEGNSTLEQQWAGQAHSCRFQQGFSICQKAWAPSGGSHPSSRGEPCTPGAPSLDTPQCTQT